MTDPGDPEKPPSTREARRLHTRKRVLAAALDVFREVGFEAANTAEIARLAGVSHGAVFTVEPTKARLAAAAFDDRLREVGERAFATAFASKRPLPERLLGVFTALFDFYEDHQGISRALLREMLLSVHDEANEYSGRLLRDYLTGLRVLLQATTPTDAEPPDLEARSTALLGIYLVFLLGQLNGVYPDREAQHDSCLRALRAVLPEV
jgi:AcrR family transcriptional regulator